MIKINKNAFAAAIKLVSKAVASNPVIPLFGNILFEARANSVTLSATNFEIGIKHKLKLVAGEEYTTTIPAELLVKLVANIHSDEIKIKPADKEQAVRLITDNSDNKIKCMLPNDFPPIPKLPGKYITIDVSVFKNAIQRVSFCAAQKDNEIGTKSGVQILIDKKKPNKLILFATNGHRLGLETLTIKNPDKITMDVIIKASTLETVYKLLESEETLKVNATQNQIYFSTKNTTVVSQLMTGKFVDYKLFETPEPKLSLKINTLDLLYACKQISVFTEGQAVWSVDESVLGIKVSTQEKGDSNITVPIKGNKKKLLFGINIFYIIQLLEITHTENVVIELVTPTSPVVIRMDGYENYCHMVMPMEL